MIADVCFISMQDPGTKNVFCLSPRKKDFPTTVSSSHLTDNLWILPEPWTKRFPISPSVAYIFASLKQEFGEMDGVSGLAPHSMAINRLLHACTMEGGPSVSCPSLVWICVSWECPMQVHKTLFVNGYRFFSWWGFQSF